MNRECCVCGGCAPSNKQWHNRDDGYAVCARCFLESVTKIGFVQSVDYYGVPGIHHSVGDTGIWDAAAQLLEGCKTAINAYGAELALQHSRGESVSGQMLSILQVCGPAIDKAEGREVK